MRVDASIGAGLAYIQSQQSPEGFWSDWSLPPGESRMWTTAYVGYRLSSLRAGHGACVEESLMKAEKWLRASEFRSGGWGYSEQTGPDADSTALVILFLTARGARVAERSLLRLVAHQQSDGGFSTYTREAAFGTWVHSHLDVTAVAALALLRAAPGDRMRITRAVRYVLERQRADGMWNSFWWTSGLYATEASLALVNCAGESLNRRNIQYSLRLLERPSAFEGALRLLCLIHADADVSLTAGDASALCAVQSADGSWLSAPVLRLTSRECSEPWSADDAGPLFADERRVFTTATVIAALGCYSASCTTRSSSLTDVASMVERQAGLNDPRLKARDSGSTEVD